MATRDILNYLGEKIGELSEPEGTTWSEEDWSIKLAPYAIPAPSPSDISASYLRGTISARKAYADDLLDRLKAKNIGEGINAAQGIWMHHRMRAVDITFGGQARTIDVMNLAISGDIEIACLTLMYATPDDMSQAWHWWSADRLNWLIADMKSYLGWS